MFSLQRTSPEKYGKTFPEKHYAFLVSQKSLKSNDYRVQKHTILEHCVLPTAYKSWKYGSHLLKSIMFSLQRTSPGKYGKFVLEEVIPLKDFFLLARHAGNNYLHLFGYHSTSLEWLNLRKRKHFDWYWVYTPLQTFLVVRNCTSSSSSSSTKLVG